MSKRNFIRWAFVLFVNLILATPLITVGEEETKEVCFDPSIASIRRALDQTGRAFDYKYRIVRKAETGFPTVIFLPGGPGQTSIAGDLAKNL